MASVQELLLAAEAQKSPFISLLEGAAGGFGKAQDERYDNTIKLMQIDQMRREQEYQAEMQREWKERKEAETKAQLNSVSGAPTPVMPVQKLKTKLSRDARGYITETIQEENPPIVSDLDRRYKESQIAANEARVSSAKQKSSQAIQAAEDKKNMRLDAADQKADIVIKTIGEAKQGISGWSTGLMGQMLSNVGGTDARNLKAKLEPIRSALAFSELQKMREMSPTGGALGQVAVKELELLEASVASLDQAQDGKQLEESLNSIQKHMNNWKAAVAQARGEGYRFGVPSPEKPPAEADNDDIGWSDEEERELRALEAEFGGR